MSSISYIFWAVLILGMMTVTLLFGFDVWQQNRTALTTWPTVVTDNLKKESQDRLAGDYKPTLEILFVGDVMLDRHIRANARKLGQDHIFSGVAGILSSADLVVANLEGPITQNRSVSEGSTVGSSNNFIFTFDPSWVDYLSKYNLKLVNLGNNHMRDFGSDGYLQTKEYLQAGQVDFFGAVYADMTENRWYFLELPDGKEIKKIAFVNYNEFVPGGLDMALSDLAESRDKVDLVILYTHWGAEYQTIANQTIQNLAYRFIDAGADVIIGSHPHVIQQKEIYQGKTIYYSLGNFIFDQYFSDDVRRGLVVRMTINLDTGVLEFQEYQTWLESDGRTQLLEVELGEETLELIRS